MLIVMGAKVPEKILNRNRLQDRGIKLKNELFLVQSELWREDINFVNCRRPADFFRLSVR